MMRDSGATEHALSVIVLRQRASQADETCRDSLYRFTPELEEALDLGAETSLGSALRQVSASFVALLDHRIALSPGWAGRLIHALEGSRAGAVGPLSNGGTGLQRRQADYQDIPEYLGFAERVAREHGGQVQAAEALDGFCVLSRRELLATLDPETRLDEVVAALLAAGHRMVVALHTYLHSFADYYQHARPELQRLIPDHPRRVLDVGCGTGALGAALKRRGPVDVVGVEVDAKSAEQARAVLDHVHVGDIEGLDLPYGPGAFDCIVLADILEHLRDPWLLIRRLAGLLAPTGGRLIASLPNVRHWSVIRGLLGGEWTYLPAGILDREHLRFFTLRSGRALFEAAGLEVVEIHPIRSGSIPDLAPLTHAARLLSLDPSTLPEEAGVTQYLYVAERRG